MFPWTDNAGTLYVGFGTHSNLEVAQDATVSDITPTLAMPSATLGANPIATTNTSTSIVITMNGHGLSVSDSVAISGAVDTDGITAANINGTRSITAVTTNTFTVTAGAAATSTNSGGGTAVVIAPQNAFAAGQIDGTGGSGYGTGAYNVGGYSQPSTADYFPRTWSFGAWGQNLLGCPRNGPIYAWTNNTGTPAAPLANSPRQVTHMVVAPNNGGYQVFALGCSQEADGVFNPTCIRHSSIRNNTEWNTDVTTTAREYILAGGGRIVAGRMCGPYLLVWTSDALWLGTFVGDLNQPWRFDRVGAKCGLLGPNAAVVVGQTAYWVSPDLQFYVYQLGGQPQIVPCPIRTDFADNMAASQGDKVVASSNAKFGEIRFDYPDARDGYENSRYIALCVNGEPEDIGAWHKGTMARTAFVDANPALYPIGVTYGGTIYYHEKGNSADGAMLAWFIESADQLIDADTRMLVRGVWPDFREQIGPVTITVKARETPQGVETAVAASPMAPGDVRADLLNSGRMFKVRFEGNSVPTNCRIGRPVFDVVPAGKL